MSARMRNKFNTWYDEVHIPLLLRFKGIMEVTRYKLLYETEGYPKYLAIYKFVSKEAYEAFQTSPEFVAAVEERDQTWKQRGYEIKWEVKYEPIRTWQR